MRYPIQLTMFEHYSKCRIWYFQFGHFLTIFVQLKLTCLVTRFDRNRSSLRSQCWMRLFGRFSNTVWLFSVYLTFLSFKIYFSIHEKTLQVVLCKESKSHQNANWGDQGRLWILPCTSGFRVWSDGAKEAEMTLILETNPHTPIFTFRHTRIC